MWVVMSLNWGIQSNAQSAKATFVSFGTTSLVYSQQIDGVASIQWLAGCDDPCFNSVTSLAAACSAGQKDLGPMPCNAAPAGFVAPPRM